MCYGLWKAIRFARSNSSKNKKSFMKANYLNRITAAFLVITMTAVLVHLTGCGGNDPAPLSKQEEVTTKLTAATWKVQSVMVGGIDKSSVYPDLNLTFTDTGFTSTNGEAVWPASGTWSFTDANATAITRDDGLTVTLQEVTDTSLKLALTWNKTTLGPGRVASVSGQHVFSFGK